MKEHYANDEFMQKRTARQLKIRKRRLKIFLICFVVFLLIVGIVLSLTLFFPIKNITAKGSAIYTPEQILTACGVEKGENIFTVSEKKTLETLKTRLPYIETVEFDRTMPDTLNITVTDAKEYVSYKVGAKYYTVSKSGWVLNSYNEQPKGVIQIVCSGAKCKVGTSLGFEEGKSDSKAREIIAELEKNKISIDYVDITETIFMKAKIEGRFIVNLGSSKDLEPKIKHLKTMITKMKKNDEGTIDLSSWNSQNRQGIFKAIDIK